MSTFIQYTKLRASLIVGGSKNNTSQATELRTRPDFIIATPGRLLDHVTNSTGCTLVDIEFLILDEADRLLDLGFSDEIMEIVKSCPIQRQTLLFSATMNTKVDDLIRLSLKNPVRVKISDQNGTNNDTASTSLEVAPRLEQEFIRIRASNEGVNREGILLALLTRTYKTQVICFFDTKVTAHRMMILAGLCGIRCAELHGNLTQPQRLMALEDFRSGNVDVLMATDLAARGLDINRVQTVINFEMPSQLATYIHRIGRTARAGRGGRSCTLIGEGRRHLMKELLKDSSNKKKKSLDNSSATNPVGSTGVILSRTVPSAVISHFAAKIQSLEVHYEEVLQAETVAKLDRIAEMEVTRAQNLIEHADEIKQRPPKEWFVSNSEKQRGAIKVANEGKNNDSAIEKPTSGMHRMTRKKRRAREVREAMEQGGDDTNEGDDQPPQSKAVNELKIKSDVRKQKRLQAEMKHVKSGLSIHDMDMQEEKKLLKKSKKKKSGTNSSDAVGDSNLFGEEKVSFATSGSKRKSESASEDKPAKSTYKFIGYNPDKKLGRKKSHNAFKSKSKHKRR
jgi:ATP-dependent RNA helicase DDX27